jgi:flagellar hook-associated protein 2
MGRISSGVGLVSGINSKDIIDQLMQLEEQPKVRLQARIDKENERRTAITELQTRLTTVRLFGTTIKKPQTFRAASANSSNEDALTATAAVGAAAGSYRLSVARLVTSQQAVSRGFEDFETAKVGAGTFTVELGGGDLGALNKLDDLNGGDGVRRGTFRITDRGGNSALIDITDSINIQDVVKKINSNLDIRVKASISNDKLVLTDTSGRTNNNLIVEDTGDGHAAEDLGIVASVASNTVNGSRIQVLSNATLLSKLNDGRGVKFAADATKADFKVKTQDGSETEINLSGAKTVKDLITKVSEQSNGKFYLTVSSDKKRLVIGDSTYDPDPDNDPDTPPPPSELEITALNDSTALADLGLSTTTGGAVKSGRAVLAGLGTTLLGSLKGGQGIDLGTIRIRGRNNQQADVNLSGAQTVQDVLDRINAASNVGVTARLKEGGNGIEVIDETGSIGTLTISDLSGTSAADLGIAGAFGFGKNARGANLQKAWLNDNTLLKDLNGGKGVPAGQFKITDSTGKQFKINLTEEQTSVGDVIAKINATPNIKVKASINANGDGILLTDTAGGTVKMKVEDDENGTVAKSLNIAGEATGTTIDGSWEKTIDVTATDTLSTISTKINDLNWGLTASIINDGSGDAPYRLTLTSTNTGRAGRVAFDNGATDLGARTLVDSQDAAVFVGSDSAAQPLLISSSSNTINGAIRGVTLNLTGVTKEPVTLNIARNVDNVVESTNKFVEDVNGLIDKMKEFTKFDPQTQERGILLGEPAAQDVEREIYSMLTTVVNKDSKYRIAADVGLRVGEEGKIEFDESKFRAAFADDPEAVTRLFTKGAETLDEDFNLQRLRDNQGIRMRAEPPANNPTAAAPDFRVSFRDGSGVDVDVGAARTLGEFVEAMQTAIGSKGTVSIDKVNNRITLKDNTRATFGKTLTVADYSGSTVAFDLGISGTARDSRGFTTSLLQGKSLLNFNNKEIGGIGQTIESRINRLIDPVSGQLTRENNDIDTRNAEFQRRIDSIDKLLTSKRERLERQFAGLESSLSNLQGQQSSLTQLASLAKK